MVIKAGEIRTQWENNCYKVFLVTTIVNKVLLENGYWDSAARMNDLSFRDYERRVTVHYEETESVEVTEFVNDDEEVVLRVTRRRPLPEPEILPLSSFLTVFFYGYVYLVLMTYLWKIKSWLRRNWTGPETRHSVDRIQECNPIIWLKEPTPARLGPTIHKVWSDHCIKHS